MKYHAWSLDPAGQAAIRRAEDGRTDAVPTLEQLFAAVPWRTTPEPRGWLTEKERGALERAFDLLCDDDGDQPLAGTVQRLLARETPPRVRWPNPNVVATTTWARDLLWIAAIREAGVEVAE